MAGQPLIGDMAFRCRRVLPLSIWASIAIDGKDLLIIDLLRPAAVYLPPLDTLPTVLSSIPLHTVCFHGSAFEISFISDNIHQLIAGKTRKVLCP
jgi:hypothetical protein